MSTHKIVLVLSLTLLGCTAPDPDAGVVVEDDTDTKADVVRPLGAYAGNSFEYFGAIGLAADHTYWWNSDVDGSTGTYRYGKSGTRRYLDLTEPGTIPFVQRYEYKLDGTTLRVRQVHDTDWETLTHTGAKGEDCTNDPNEGAGTCEANLVCVAHEGCRPTP